MGDLRELITKTEEHAVLPPGQDERFTSYGVMSVPFESGYVLALRRFPVTSIGPGYTSVWLRRPTGAWTIYADAAPEMSCSRYFGSALESSSVHDITITWHDGDSFTVRIGDDVDLTWNVRVEAAPVTRLMSAFAGVIPGPLWRSRVFLKAMGAVAGPSMRAGRIGLVGEVPNHQAFRANPHRMWFVAESSATLQGEDLGRLGPLSEQTRLGDFWIPQRGIVMIGSSAFETFDPGRHLPATAA